MSFQLCSEKRFLYARGNEGSVMLRKGLSLHTQNRGACSASEKNCLKRRKESHLPSERATIVPYVRGRIQSRNRATLL